MNTRTVVDGTDTTARTDTSAEVRLNLLGPLEVTRGHDVLPLGGPRRRAVLGCLLLRCNEVVPAGGLITALWGSTAPPSARKGVQNVVWHLRTALSAGAESTGPRLLTRPPGYLLRAEPDHVDLLRFQELAARGRALCADGLLPAASRVWREALALWRGPALSDLVETGVSWPELRALEEARLDVFEDYFDAELRLGHHHHILPRIRRVARDVRHRERLPAQLMTALYRCGRQGEALAVYRDFATALVAELGLEPGRELTELHRAVLAHDPGLLRPSHETSALVGAVRRRTGSPAVPAVSALPAGQDGPVHPAHVRSEVTAVLLRAVIRPPSAGADARGESGLAEVCRSARTEAERFGGGVAARLGALWLLVFTDTGTHDRDHARRAVSAALAVRHHFASDRWGASEVGVRAAVATGEVLIHYPGQAGAPLSIAGVAVDDAQNVLYDVDDGEVWVTEETFRRTAEHLEYRPVEHRAGAWAAHGAHPPGLRPTPTPAPTPLPGGPSGQPGPQPGSQPELPAELLAAAADDSAPRVLLVTGDAGMGKSRLLEEFERAVTASDRTSVVVRAPVAAVDDSTLRLLGTGLRDCCGITADDSGETAVRRLVEAIQRSGADDPDRYLARLAPLLDGTSADGDRGGRRVSQELLLAWWRLVTAAPVPHRRAVVLVDDLDLAGDELLDLIEGCAPGPGSSLVVAAARPALLDRRPGWSTAAGRPALTLRPWDTATVARHVAERAGQHPLGGRFARLLTEVTGGNPRMVAAYTGLLTVDGMRSACHDGGVVVPDEVRRRVRAELAALPGLLRHVAETVGVVGEAAWPAAVAEACGLAETEAVALLGELVRRRVLECGGGDGPGRRYGFRTVLERHVARSGWSAGDRLGAHRTVTEWLRRLDGDPGVSRHLRREALRLEAATGRGVDDLARRALAGQGTQEPPFVLGAGGRTAEYLALAETPSNRLVELDRVVRAWGSTAADHRTGGERRPGN
ncbi:BTAD domain-containing putative transcriptional regulator [Streptomyces qinzhouensis]|uniref:AAA family ATPase n=1 Tax=Streptomyces qinzhouensis TaxID=2599401 RepID=A0A5B8IE48_9ACTN|nr:BTAD domain-containing putative transcriptional regulator [Streptomyces qinzhouensis]QDY75409.1 AAA family ATPase [Streptomyces qinzhouensis]